MDSVTVHSVIIEQDNKLSFPVGFPVLYSRTEDRIRVSPDAWIEVERLMAIDKHKLASAIETIANCQKKLGHKNASAKTALTELLTRWNFSRTHPDAGPGKLFDSITITKEGLEVLRERFGYG